MELILEFVRDRTESRFFTRRMFVLVNVSNFLGAVAHARSTEVLFLCFYRILLQLGLALVLGNH